MGCWNETCMVTQIPILSNDKVVLYILKNDNQRFSPVSLPMIGLYNDYGQLEDNSIENEDIHLEFLNNIKVFKDFKNVYEIINGVEREEIKVEEDYSLSLAFIHYDVFKNMIEISSKKYKLSYNKFYNDIINSKNLNHKFRENNCIFLERVPDNIFLEFFINHYWEYPISVELKEYTLIKLLKENDMNEVFIRLIYNLNLFDLALTSSRKVYQTYNKYSGSQREEYDVHLYIADFIKEKYNKNK